MTEKKETCTKRIINMFGPGKVRNIFQSVFFFLDRWGTLANFAEVPPGPSLRK
jgi:hypothetical protein